MERKELWELCRAVWGGTASRALWPQRRAVELNSLWWSWVCCKAHRCQALSKHIRTNAAGLAAHRSLSGATSPTVSVLRGDRCWDGSSKLVCTPGLGLLCSHCVCSCGWYFALKGDADRNTSVPVLWGTHTQAESQRLPCPCQPGSSQYGCALHAHYTSSTGSHSGLSRCGNCQFCFHCSSWWLDRAVLVLICIFILTIGCIFLYCIWHLEFLLLRFLFVVY